MIKKRLLTNAALVAVSLLGFTCGRVVLAQAGPDLTPTPDLHYLNQANQDQQQAQQAQPGGVPIVTAPVAEPVVTLVVQDAPGAVPANHSHMGQAQQAQPGGVPIDSASVTPSVQEAAPVEAQPVQASTVAVAPVASENAAAAPAAAQDAAQDAAPAAVSQVCGAAACSQIYLPLVVSSYDGSSAEADPNGLRATVIAIATRLANKTPTSPAPTPTRAGPTPRPNPSATPRPNPSATPRPGATATRAPAGPTPTATTMPPPASGDCLNCVNPSTLVPVPNPAPNVSGQMCPAWAHDLWVVTGPNGKLYRTWHPPVQPSGMAGAGCNFDHSHGTKRDPRGSTANPTLPAYGYDADLHGMAEPHAGFKTEWANRGDCNQLEGFCSTSDLQVTVHMGTAGAGRITVGDHTFIFDMIGDKGTIIHVRGMGDTGKAATQCDPAPDTSGSSGFRLIAMPKDQAALCNISSPYEVWQFHLTVGDNIINSKFANFDGITVGRRQPDGSFVLEQTSKTWPNAPFSGCEHDVYFGGFLLKSNFDGVDMHGVRQYIKLGSDGGRVVLDTSAERKNTYKRPFDGCGPVPYTVN